MSSPAAGQTLAVTVIEDDDVADVVALWRRCGSTRPWNDPAGDIALARKRAERDGAAGRDGNALVASVLVGHDGHRGWVYYVTVDPDHRAQRATVGAIMTSAEDWLRARGIEKLQLMVRGDNAKVHAFYESLGYYDQERVIFAKWLDGRDPTP